jgi:hydroxymethylbilane synthase
VTAAPPARLPRGGVLRLATRGSALALAQARLAASALGGAGAGAVAIVVIRTAGDRQPDTPADAMEGEGWFTSELEAALLGGRADCAVHSAKDLPTELAAGLAVVAHLERGDPRDALALRPGEGRSLADLVGGARVGTSSPRRAAQLLAARPDVRVVSIRGNVDTRLSKLDGGEVDALLLACAGLDRLGRADRVTVRLDPRRHVPAPAQGAVALEVTEGGAAAALVTGADHAATTIAVRAERALLARLGGGCRLPLGAWARLEGGRLVLSASLGTAGGAVRYAELAGDAADPLALAGRVAAELAG